MLNKVRFSLCWNNSSHLKAKHRTKKIKHNIRQNFGGQNIPAEKISADKIFGGQNLWQQSIFSAVLTAKILSSNMHTLT